MLWIPISWLAWSKDESRPHDLGTRARFYEWPLLSLCTSYDEEDRIRTRKFSPHIVNIAFGPDIVACSDIFKRAILIDLTCGNEEKFEDQWALLMPMYGDAALLSSPCFLTSPYMDLLMGDARSRDWAAVTWCRANSIYSPIYSGHVEVLTGYSWPRDQSRDLISLEPDTCVCVMGVTFTQLHTLSYAYWGGWWITRSWCEVSVGRLQCSYRTG